MAAQCAAHAPHLVPGTSGLHLVSIDVHYCWFWCVFVCAWSFACFASVVVLACFTRQHRYLPSSLNDIISHSEEEEKKADADTYGTVVFVTVAALCAHGCCGTRQHHANSTKQCLCCCHPRSEPNQNTRERRNKQEEESCVAATFLFGTAQHGGNRQ